MPRLSPERLTGILNLLVKEHAGAPTILSEKQDQGQVHRQWDAAEAPIQERDLIDLAMDSRELFLSQPPLLEIAHPTGEMIIVGDTHGQFSDVLKIFALCGWPDKFYYLFLGDYVDRGARSIEAITLLLAFKNMYPQSFHMLRGNHEAPAINRVYGFYDECKRRFSVKVWKAFCDTFACLPVAAVVHDRIFCCHGGISPDIMQTLDPIRRIIRPTDIPDVGVLCDLLWADPNTDEPNCQTPFVENKQRGISVSFNVDAVRRFKAAHNFDLVVRAHECVEDGYTFFGDRSLLTLFSAPNYCGDQDNAAAMLVVNAENLMCSFKVLRPPQPNRRGL